VRSRAAEAATRTVVEVVTTIGDRAAAGESAVSAGCLPGDNRVHERRWQDGENPRAINGSPIAGDRDVSTVMFPMFSMPPPRPSVPKKSLAVFPLTVLFASDSVPKLRMPPPSPPVVFPLMVLFVSVAVSRLSTPPPAAAVLPLTVLLSRISVPTLLEMPPPCPKLVTLPLTVLELSVSVPTML
jgi:hypothetical protein